METPTPDNQKQSYFAMLESLKVPSTVDKDFLYATFLYTLEGAKNLVRRIDDRRFLIDQCGSAHPLSGQ
jgi:hypothetical protein